MKKHAAGLLFIPAFLFFLFPPSIVSARITREDFAFLNTYRIKELEIQSVEESSFKLQEGGIEPELQNTINTSLEKAFDYILARQSLDGSWKDVVDSATNYTAYYIILMHYLERVDAERQSKAARYILSKQLEGGPWVSFPGGPPDTSLTLMNYFALKLAGLDPDLPSMAAARQYLESNLQLGSIAGWDLFIMAFMGQLPLEIIAGPYPKAIIFLPDFLPNIKDLPTVPRIAVIPALLLVQPEAVFAADGAAGLSDLTLIRNINSKYADSSMLDESPALRNSGLTMLMQAIRIMGQEAAIVQATAQEGAPGLFLPDSFNSGSLPLCFDSAGPDRNTTEFLTRIKTITQRAPVDWGLFVADCLSPEHRLFESIKKIPEKSGLFYANSLLTVFYLAALKTIDCGQHPSISRIEVEALIARGLAGLADLSVEDDEYLFMPLVKSDIWDTAHMLGHLQAYNPANKDIAANLTSGIVFLLDRQSRTFSEWKRHNLFGLPGGWGFEDHNVRQPDPDDTSMVLRALYPHVPADRAIREAFQRGANWLLSMRNDDGGFPMFERQGDGIYNFTPLVAEYSPVQAMYDESLLEMSARIATVMMKDLGFTALDYEIKKIAGLIKEQRDGMLFESIWFANFIFATATVNRFLALAGEDMTEDIYRNTNAWMNGLQHADGGWGESPASFYGSGYVDFSQSSPLITSAVISSKIDQLLHSDLADYDTEFPVIKKGLEFLVASQNAEGFWDEPTFVNSYMPREKMHCNYGLATKLAPYDGLLNGLKFLNGLQAE